MLAASKHAHLVETLCAYSMPFPEDARMRDGLRARRKRRARFTTRLRLCDSKAAPGKRSGSGWLRFFRKWVRLVKRRVTGTLDADVSIGSLLWALLAIGVAVLAVDRSWFRWGEGAGPARRRGPCDADLRPSPRRRCGRTPTPTRRLRGASRRRRGSGAAAAAGRLRREGRERRGPVGRRAEQRPRRQSRGSADRLRARGCGEDATSPPRPWRSSMVMATRRLQGRQDPRRAGRFSRPRTRGASRPRQLDASPADCPTSRPVRDPARAARRPRTPGRVGPTTSASRTRGAWPSAAAAGGSLRGARRESSRASAGNRSRKQRMRAD